MTAVYQQITVNSGIGVRREKMGGREYLVAPVSMLVPGVLNGSKGPLLYPETEVVKNYGAWNYMPLTLDHPTDDKGNAVSARHPSVIEKFGLGFVFNVSTKKGKLDGEAWFDIQRVEELAPDLISKLTSNQTIELSTGLSVDQKPVSNVGASYKGKPYTAIAYNYRPDHLAILLHKRGACSLEDGCGVLVNEWTSAEGVEAVGEEDEGSSVPLAVLTNYTDIDEMEVMTNEACEDPTSCDCHDCKNKTKKTKKKKKKGIIVGNVTLCPIMAPPCPITNASACGAGGGKGAPGFQRGNTCAGGGKSGKGGFKVVKTKDGPLQDT